MAAATVDPHDRDAVPAAGSYRRGDRVWVYRHGGWQPGVVENASDRAVLVTYRVADQRGSLVDTLTAEYVMARTTGDPFLDHGGGVS